MLCGLAAMLAGCASEGQAPGQQGGAQAKRSDPTARSPGMTVRAYLEAYSNRSPETCSLLTPRLRANRSSKTCLRTEGAERAEALDQPQAIVDSQTTQDRARVLALTNGRVPVVYMLRKVDEQWRIHAYELKRRLRRGEEPALE